MPDALDRMVTQSHMGQNRLRLAFERAVGTGAAGNDLPVVHAGSARSRHQIIQAVDFVQMGTLHPRAAVASPDNRRLRQHLARQRIDLVLDHVGVHPLSVLRRHISAAVVIKEQGRINVAVRQQERIGPRPFGTLRRHIEIADASYIRSNYVEAAAVIAQRGGVNAGGASGCAQVCLGAAGQDMPHWLPVDQVPAVKQGHAGKIFKRAGDQIIVVLHANDAGIRIITGNNRILIGDRLHRVLLHLQLGLRAVKIRRM